jgi:hemolysin activation/secretion protein
MTCRFYFSGTVIVLPVNLAKGQRRLDQLINSSGQCNSLSTIMFRKRTVLLLLLSTGVQAESLLDVDSVTEESAALDESRQNLQGSANDIHNAIEEGRHTQFKQKKSTEITEPEIPVVDVAQCLLVKSIYIQGITLLTDEDFDSLTKIPEDCINSTDANLLARELTAIYISKGYITTRIQFIEPNANGELGLDVIEGFIEGVESDDTELNGETLFPNMIGQPLNIANLDQALDQANRLSSNNITVDIIPGEQPGGSILKLHNERSKPWHLTTSLDNYGNKNTGKWLNHNTFSFDNPFGLSDAIGLNTSSTVDNPQSRYSRSYSLFYSVPYGAFTFSAFGSYSEYTHPVELQYNTIALEGDTQQHGLRTDYVYYRDNDEINSLSTQLTYKRANNYLNEEKLDISSPTLSIFELGLNHLHVLAAGIFSINFSIERGLPWLGADDNNGPNNLYNSEFTKAKINTLYNQYFTLFDDVYLFSNRFYGQYTRDRLPGVEWLSITDSSSVRGFSRNSLSADKGWYSQNTLSRTFTFGETTLTPRLGFDVGRIQSNPQGWSGTMGISLGVSANYHDFKLDVEASRGRLLSGQSPVKDPTQILARFSYSF